MNLGTILGLLGSLLKLILALPRWIDAYVRRQVESDTARRTKEIRAAVEEAKNAKTTSAKAAAACRIEKALRPDSDCGA